MAMKRWIVVGVIVAVLAVPGAWLSYRHYTTRQEAVTKFKKAVSEERKMMEESSKIRDPVAADAALSRMKEHLAEGDHVDGTDATASQAMGKLVEKFQLQRREFDAALAQVRQEKVFRFAIRERATIEQHRQILYTLLESNSQLTYFEKHADELLRAELVKVNLPLEVREQTVEGFTRPRATTHAAEMKIRDTYETIGETGLEILSLLDANWGKWRFDETAGQFRSDDHDFVAAYSEKVQKLGTAQKELEKAKQEFAEKRKIVQQQLDAQMKEALSQ